MYSTKEMRSSNDVKADNRKALREYHRQTLAELNVPETSLDGKVAFMYNGRKVVTAFGNQLNRDPHGYYFEITDNVNNPLDSNRTLYWIRPNPNYNEEYEEQSDKNSDKGYHTPETKMYYFPLEEAVQVTKGAKMAAAIMKDSRYNVDQLDTTVPSEDMDISKLTILDLFAIMSQEPVSNKKFLNEKIMQIKNQKK